MNQKGFVPILIVILATFLAVGGYLTYTKYLSNQTKVIIPQTIQQSPVTAESTNSREITNWQMYNNTAYKFSLKYPNGWKQSVTEEDHLLFEDNRPFGNMVEIGIYPDSGGLSAQEFVEDELYKYMNSEDYNVLKQDWLNHLSTVSISIDGKQATQLNGLTQLSGSYGPGLWITEDSVGIFVLSLNPSEEGNEIFNKIISTFKFTDQVGVSNFILNKESLTGIWHSMDVLGSGWAERYQFYPSGKYAHVASTMDCGTRDLGEIGTWDLKDNKLALVPKKKVVLVGGKVEKGNGSCGSPTQIVGAKKEVQVIETTQTFEMDLTTRQKQANESPYYPSMSFGKTPFWKFNNSLKDNPPFKDLRLSGCGPDEDLCF